MNIEIFKVSDLEQMMIFLDNNITENYEERVFLTIHQRWPEGFLLVKDQEDIIGIGCGTIMPNEKLRILILALDQKFQGRGLGKKLMNQMIEASRIYGVQKVTLEVRKDSDAINFYRKLRFSSVDVLPCYYQDGCDGIVMERQL
ncbi:MAG: GNAT family N-acetyltransferase [Dehalococcoidia bacterium]|jgi:ribosomal protein S18 acetylase RimI-like enzyme|nr:GNAT family N-acetyltransferase [Dehalococcoidia bacterium]|tara:strand:- start:53 stop:484 length:432 start_codon:yes stop_codon:yes gene_type:complete